MTIASYKQDLQAEEDKLFTALSKIYKSIKRDYGIAINNTRVHWSDIETIYKKQTDDVVRSAVTQMYQISARKTVERDIKVPYFLTQIDMEVIRQYTQKYQDWLWIGLEREIVKKTMTAFDPRTFLRIDPSQIKLKDTFIGRMTESVHGEVAAAAVIAKAKQVVATNRGNNYDIKSRRSFSTVSSFRQAAITDNDAEPHLVWRTAQENTCEQCEALDGQVFAIDDPSIPTPVEDTHPRCVCTLELVDAEEVNEIETVEDLLATELL